MIGAPPGRARGASSLLFDRFLSRGIDGTFCGVAASPAPSSGAMNLPIQSEQHVSEIFVKTCRVGRRSQPRCSTTLAESLERGGMRRGLAAGSFGGGVNRDEAKIVVGDLCGG